MLTVLFLAGLGSVVAGVALVSVPAALVVAGLTLQGLALGIARGRARRAAPPVPEPAGGDS